MSEIIYRCNHCGSKELKIRGWVDPNDKTKVEFQSEDFDDGWCNHCYQEAKAFTETEMLRKITEWWHSLPQADQNNIVARHWTTFGTECHLCGIDWWNAITIEQKIFWWNISFIDDEGVPEKLNSIAYSIIQPQIEVDRKDDDLIDEAIKSEMSRIEKFIYNALGKDDGNINLCDGSESPYDYFANELIEKIANHIVCQKQSLIGSNAQIQSNATTLDDILQSRDRCERFAKVIIDEIKSDDESLHNIGHHVITSYQNGDCDALLIALCGWSMNSLVEKFNQTDKITEPFCPKCECENISINAENCQVCGDCGLTWDDNLYVLVEFPDDTTYFEQEQIGYPCFNCEDNGARYVPEYEYILQFGKKPDENKYFTPIQWPDSQEYLELQYEDESSFELCELIEADEKALEDFGGSALWVPLSLIKNK